MDEKKASGAPGNDPRKGGPSTAGANGKSWSPPGSARWEDFPSGATWNGMRARTPGQPPEPDERVYDGWLLDDLAGDDPAADQSDKDTPGQTESTAPAAPEVEDVGSDLARLAPAERLSPLHSPIAASTLVTILVTWASATLTIAAILFPPYVPKP